MELAAASGYRTLALTDINTTSACLNFIRLAPEYGIHAVTGVDFRNGMEQKFVALALNNAGFQEINAYLSRFLHAGKAFPDQPEPFVNAAVIYPYAVVRKLGKTSFGAQEYVGVTPEDLRNYTFRKEADFRDRMVMLVPVSFRGKRDFNMHRLLRAIDGNTLLSKLSPQETAADTETFSTADQLRETYAGYPFLAYRTDRLLEQCRVYFGFGAARENQNLRVFGATEAGDLQELRRLCEEGLSERYPVVTPEIRQRLEKELELIRQMGFVPFFLINHAIVSYAQEKDYYYVGRGSGANSIVAYLLKITNVDPIELDLYFERFINLYRASPPDFDIDFSSRDREDVTRYIFSRFGRKGQTALLATYNTFQLQAAIRELGKVMGLPPHEIDRLAEGKGAAAKDDQLSGLVLRYAGYMQQDELPNYLSVHAGGILIADRPIHYFSATWMPPKGFPSTQFDMLVAEDIGLNKFDILGQRGLAKIKETLGIIRYNQPEAPPVAIHDTRPFMRDEKVNRLIREATCIGCFYVESPGMRMLLKKLEVDNYLGLVAASSIIRPGVAKSGMMREYILRHREPEREKASHPLMLELMKETHGVMVYQEDVIKVAHYFGGLTLGEADILRRGMSGKFRSRSEFHLIREKFYENCREKGYPDSLTQAVWMQMESFAGYAFAKGHSASYAVESYQTLFLKAYYPLEFMVAVLNSGGGFYGPELYVHEARMQGGTVHVPCINESRSETRIRGKDIYLGLSFISGLEEQLIRQSVHERERNGPFASLTDFMERVPVAIEQIRLLIRIGAFRFTGEDRKVLLWKALYFLNGGAAPSVTQGQLFRQPPRRFRLPVLETSAGEDAFEQIELLGFPLCSPFELLLHPPETYLPAAGLSRYINTQVTVYGYLVAIKNARTAKGERMYFGTFTDHRGAFIDTVHFPPVSHPFRGKGVYKITGKVVDEFGFLSIEVRVLEKQAYRPDPRFADE